MMPADQRINNAAIERRDSLLRNTNSKTKMLTKHASAAQFRTALWVFQNGLLLAMALFDSTKHLRRLKRDCGPHFGIKVKTAKPRAAGLAAEGRPLLGAFHGDDNLLAHPVWFGDGLPEAEVGTFVLRDDFDRADVEQAFGHVANNSRAGEFA